MTGKPDPEPADDAPPAGAKRSIVSPWLFCLGQVLVRLLGRLLFGLRGYGKENFPRKGGFLLCCNHTSHLDPPLVAACAPRQVAFLARDSLFVGVFGRLIRFFGAFPLRREGVDTPAIRQGVRVMRAGLGLLVFPEGTRSTDGRLGPLKRGVALLAARAEVPIMPCYIHGSNRALPRGARFIRPFHAVRVLFGEPFTMDEFPPELPQRQRYDAFLRRLEAALRALQEEAVRRWGEKFTRAPDVSSAEEKP